MQHPAEGWNRAERQDTFLIYDCLSLSFEQPTTILCFTSARTSQTHPYLGVCAFTAAAERFARYRKQREEQMHSVSSEILQTMKPVMLRTMLPRRALGFIRYSKKIPGRRKKKYDARSRLTIAIRLTLESGVMAWHDKASHIVQTKSSSIRTSINHLLRTSLRPDFQRGRHWARLHTTPTSSMGRHWSRRQRYLCIAVHTCMSNPARRENRNQRAHLPACHPRSTTSQSKDYH